MTEVVIRLDKSRYYSETHGDRQPGDPHYHVHYTQDGLPFDGSGILVPDDGKREPWIVGLETDEGKIINVKHHPLYTDAMREKVNKRIDRITKFKSGAVSKIETDDEEDRVDEKPSVDEVDFGAWLRGEMDYETFILFPAWAKRKGRKHTKLRDLVEDLVRDERIIPEEEVSPRLRGLLPQDEAV
jgi:hypothetical protein